MTKDKNNYSFATRAIHAGSHPDPSTGAVIPPIDLSTTYAQKVIGESKFEYTRSGNDTRNRFETVIASLEGGRYGLAFSSGSAVTATLHSFLGNGKHIISVHDVYGGTHRFMTQVAPNLHKQEFSFADLRNPSTLQKLVKPSTAAIWIESPSNPTLTLIDIRAISSLAKSLNPNIIIIVDNTFLSPYLSNPLELGADIVVHSVTKLINGHSDVLLGALVTNNETFYTQLKFLQNAYGNVPDPHALWLAHRGVKTLHLRARTASESALALATYLESHSQVISVSYPGLKSHPQHALTKTQHRDGLGGTMIAFRIRGGESAAGAFLKNTKIFTLAESLGGVESLAELPAQMTHQGLGKEARAKAGVFDDLIRLSVGIEDVEDLMEDLRQALEVASNSPDKMAIEEGGDSGVASDASSDVES